MTARVFHYRGYRIEVAGVLAEAVVAASAEDDFCPLCNSHPSSGHGRSCPLVVDAIERGATLIPEPEDD